MEYWSIGVLGFRCITRLLCYSPLATSVLQRFERIERLERFEPFRRARLAINEADLNSVADKFRCTFHTERSHHLIFVSLDGTRGKL